MEYKDISLVIMSSDGYDDCWYPFYKCLNKYWENHPKAYIVTEKKDCDYFNTIKTYGVWTKRLREALEQINTKYVVLMLEDFFIRNYVDEQRIKNIKMQSNDEVFNFEQSCRLPIQPIKAYGFNLRKNKTMYLNSCQPSLHDRKKLIARLQKDQTPWEWELTLVDNKSNFYVNTEKLIIDIGYYNHQPWSIKDGKWCREIIPFFEKEGIEMDYEKRGFWD